MKARVKATGEIVEVEDCGSIFRCGILFPGYKDTNGIQYLRNEIDFDFCKARQDETPYSPDYWTRLEHQYAGMAMQGLLSNPSITESKLITRKGIVEDAERLAHALVQKLKEKK